jgi:hypothetical protein
LLVDGFSSNGELCLNCLSHSRGQAQIVLLIDPCLWLTLCRGHTAN